MNSLKNGTPIKPVDYSKNTDFVRLTWTIPCEITTQILLADPEIEFSPKRFSTTILKGTYITTDTITGYVFSCRTKLGKKSS